MAAQDLRTLIPRTRRAVDGAQATSTASPATSLSDDQLIGLIADSVAEVVFFTGGVFGHELTVTERDATYGAPSAWAIDPGLSEAEATVVVATAALTHFYQVVRDLKVQEDISDEGSSWSYHLSAQLLVEHVRHLQADRDNALQLVEHQQAISTAWVNTVHERDRHLYGALAPFAILPYSAVDWLMDELPR